VAAVDELLKEFSERLRGADAPSTLGIDAIAAESVQHWQVWAAA
jgi:hypothetical protein